MTTDSTLREWIEDVRGFLWGLADRNDDIGVNADGLGQSIPGLLKALTRPPGGSERLRSLLSRIRPDVEAAPWVIAELAALASSQGAEQRQEEAPEWRDGAPSKPWAGEWFIAETDFGRMVLRALPEEWTYDFTTADDTYIKREKIKRWMQFPDSDFIAPPATPHPEPAATQGDAVDLCEVARELERVHVAQVIAEVAAVAGDRTDAYWSGHAIACEEIAHRLNLSSPTGVQAAQVSDCSHLWSAPFSGGARECLWCGELKQAAQAVGEVRIQDGSIVSTSIKRPLPDGGYDVVPQLAHPGSAAHGGEDSDAD